MFYNHLEKNWHLSLVIVWGYLIKSAYAPERFPLLLSPYQLWAEEELDSATEVWKKTVVLNVFYKFQGLWLHENYEF